MARKTIWLIICFLCISSHLSALEIMPESVDFGTVPKDSSIKKYMLLRNNSDKTIEIIGIQSECGLDLSLNDKLIKPKQIKEALLMLSSGSNQGYFKERVKLIYKKERINAVQIKDINVSWYTSPVIYSEIEIFPLTIDFGEIPSDAEIQFDLTAMNRGNTAGAVTVLSKDEGISMPQNVKIAPDSQQYIKGTLFANKAGYGKKKIIFSTTDHKNKHIEVALNYNVVTDDRAANRIIIGNIEKKQGKNIIPVSIKSNNTLQIVQFSDSDGVTIPSTNSLPDVIKKGETKKYFLEIDEKAYQSLQSSYLYLQIGILLEDR